MKTTRQVIEETEATKQIAVRWASANGVRKFGREYQWTGKDIQNFKARNKKRGNPNWV